MFQSHRLEQTENGFNVILYLDQNMSEFATELGTKQTEEKETELQKGAMDYLRKRVPNLKINAIKVVMGSIMIASIPLTQSAFANPVEASQVTQVENNQITYTVSSGDTLYSIAQKFNVKIDLIKSLNNLPGNTIKVGEGLIIPSTSYSVKAGDTLYSIATKYNLSVDTIMEINKLESTTIKIGQTLTIPSNELASMPAPSKPVLVETSHTVKAGDTLYGIANQYGVSVDQLKHANGLTGNTIQVGQALAIPKANETTTAPAPVQQTTTQITQVEDDTYTVKSGDTLIGIATLHNISVDALKKANSLSTDLIQVGQILSIPNDAPAQEAVKKPTIHVVQTGESLSSISNKYSMPIDDIKAINGLSGDTIYVGQSLRLDGASQTSTAQNQISYKTHTVESGDTIWALSVKYGIPQAELLKANHLTTSSPLSIGQKLQVPVHEIAVQPTVSEKHGEFLDWWTEAQYVFPINSTAKVTDFQTGKSFYVKRTIGANHADVEPVSAKDTSIMKEVWGGSFSWVERAVIVEVDGRKIAGSMTSMPHDVQYIKDNNFNGHTDIHFKNSTRHKDGQINARHQQQVQIAAGITQP
ncbi:LysM peptidoglycan-binding domain-containing protein [Salinibacillus xinjiangensis]|nr:LysM peptidoglycan-binding domain-containing protein [Salinibacillus xinjiangensis]